MLYSVIVSICLLAQAYALSCPAIGTAPASNTGSNNYVIDIIEEFGQPIPFPYAMKQCQSHSISSDLNFFRYTCQTDGTLTTDIYSDSGCETLLSSTNAPVVAPAGEVGYFVCGGDDTYAEVKLGMDTTGNGDGCKATKTFYLGLSGCTDLHFGGFSLSIYCDSAETRIEVFNKTSHHSKMARNMEIFEILMMTNASSNSSEESTSSTTTTKVSTSSTSTTSTTMDSMTQCDTAHHCVDFDATNSETCTMIGKLSIFFLYGQSVSCTGTVATTTTVSAAVGSHVSLLGALVTVLIALRF